jgi:hypothetical protein
VAAVAGGGGAFGEGVGGEGQGLAEEKVGHGASLVGGTCFIPPSFTHNNYRSV